MLSKRAQNDPKDLGRWVADAREARSMTQEQLASRVGIGTSSLRLIERGRAHGPSLYTVLRLFELLGLDCALLGSIDCSRLPPPPGPTGRPAAGRDRP